MTKDDQTSKVFTSAGVRWSDLPDNIRGHAEWIDGRFAPTQDGLPSVEEVPIPSILFSVSHLHVDRPRGTKAMADAGGAKHRLAGRRPGAWLVSPFTGWRWAKWPNGEIGWLPRDVQLPDVLRVSSRDDAAG